jgi:hypothetical protein
MRLVVGILAALGAIYAATAVIAFIGIPGIENCLAYPIMQVPSPDSSFVAKVENQSCTPTNELLTNIYLSGRGLPANTSEMVFSAPSSKQDVGTYSPLALKLTWQSDSTLEVAYPRGTKVRIQTKEAGAAKVVFRESLVQP